jgi:hypothetical protein
MAGYFVCGFQVVFIGVHMPSYLKDQGLTPDVATTALALIGLFNVFGTYAAGALGQRMAKRHILAGIYLRARVAIVAFLLAPLTPWSVYVFSAVMGLLWLSTVPPTNAIVAQIFGVQYMSMLGGFVFLSHQVGSFLGVWLGGKLYDCTGSYDVVWWIAVALGVFAALANLPVREDAPSRGRAAAGMNLRAALVCLWAGALAGAGRGVCRLPEPALVVDLANRVWSCASDARQRRPRPGCSAGRTCCRPAARCWTWPAAAAATCAGWPRRATGDRRRPRRGRAGIGPCGRLAEVVVADIEAAPGRCRPALRRRGGHQLPVAAAAGRRSWQRGRRRRADLRDLCRRPADRGPAVAARLPAAAGRTAAACAGLRVVAYEDGFDGRRPTAASCSASRRRAGPARRRRRRRPLSTARYGLLRARPRRLKSPIRPSARNSA